MYIIVFILLLGMYLFRNSFTFKSSELAFLVLVGLVIVLRYGVGGDYFSYQLIYDQVNTSDLLNSIAKQPEIEPLFLLVIAVFKLFHLPYHVFIVAMNFLMLYFTMKLIEEHSPTPSLSYFIYFGMSFLFWNLGAIRQGIVIAGLLYFYFKKDFPVSLKALLTVLFCMIHISGIIVPIVYLLSKIKWKKYQFMIMVLMIPLFRLILHPDMVASLASLPLLGKFAKYLTYDSISLLSMPSLLRMFMVMSLIYFYDFLISKFSEHTLLIHFTLLNLMMYFFIPGSMVMGTRLTVYGYYTMMIVFPMIIESIEFSKFNTLVTIVTIVFCMGVFSNELLKQVDRTGYRNGVLAFNYETIFNGDINRFANQRAIKKNVQVEGLKNIKETSTYQNYLTSEFKVEKAKENDIFVPVKFDRSNMFGVVNTLGDVIFEPVFANRPTIYNNTMETVEWINSFQRKQYFNVPTQRLIDYDVVRDEVSSVLMMDQDYLSETLVERELLISEYSSVPLPIDISFKSVVYVSKIDQRADSQHSYYKIATAVYSFFVVVDGNNMLINNQIYEAIQPYNGKGYMIGTVNGYKEYVNLKGDTFWIETN